MATLNYKHLRYFHATAHEGNLTRAAEKLHVSQSALSSQIRQLEHQLGQALFERRGRRLVLTEAGRIALDHADRIFSTGEELLAVLTHRMAARQHVLRVGAQAHLSRNFQIEFLKPLLARNDVEIVARSGNVRDLLASLESHNLDVVLTNVAPASDAATPWVIHKIAEQRISLVGPVELDQRYEGVEDLLQSEPLILPTLGSSIRSRFDAMAHRLGVTPMIAAEVEDMAMLRLMAREARQVCVLPPIVVRDELRSGSLTEIAQLPDLRETFYTITLDRQFPNPLLRDLWAEGGGDFR
ncbi:LysR family transcriptional regulator [Tamilnaduibacter salinus]|uniref:LysR family transcriptional regulator n=1 Tax=Tamilnaduibacter salinus TaxID=1484056 RepID=A0A2A2I1U1_9GAMM|nr:LysR family transcriptional regulator [Tamilnaduibacter salinus]PAV25388.1 LysR family transcriptional regulator [Tamilnaduibacter salinus]PVY76409.1 LysR family transcriptional regulator [Tamilnaduibacter salinus]